MRRMGWIVMLLGVLGGGVARAQTPVVIKAIDSATGVTTEVGNGTDHAIRVTQASGGTVWTFNWTQLLGAAPSATNPMPSRLTDGTTFIDPRSIRALTSADVVTVVQGTGSNLHVVVDTAPTTAVTGPATDAQLRATPLPVSLAANQSVNLNQVGGASFALGQQLAAASLPIVLTAAQLSTLTPPAAIVGFALEAGHLAAIDTATAKIPAQGQAAMAASTPVVIANNQSAVPVSGPITDTQIRASALPVSLATAPTTPVTNAGLSNLDVLLSTRTKPADQQHVIIDTIPTTAVTLATAPTTPVTNAGLTNLDLALSALRDAITAASPNNKTLNDLYTQLAAVVAAIVESHTAAASTIAPSKVDVVAGVTADATPQYQPLPLARGGGAVVVAASTLPLPPSLRCNALRRTNCVP